MIVLDTCSIIWQALQPEKLSKKARQEIDKSNCDNGLIVCEISFWEIAMLIKSRRLVIETEYLDFINLILAANKYILKGITPEIADISVNFPDSVNKDPADRIISATSVFYHAKLVTADENLRKSGVVPVIW